MARGWADLEPFWRDKSIEYRSSQLRDQWLAAILTKRLNSMYFQSIRLCLSIPVIWHNDHTRRGNDLCGVNPGIC